MFDPGVLLVRVHLGVLVRLILVHPVRHRLYDFSHLFRVAERVAPGLVEFVQDDREQLQQGFLDTSAPFGLNRVYPSVIVSQSDSEGGLLLVLGERSDAADWLPRYAYFTGISLGKVLVSSFRFTSCIYWVAGPVRRAASEHWRTAVVSLWGSRRRRDGLGPPVEAAQTLEGDPEAVHVGEHVEPLAPVLLFKASLKALLFVTIRPSRSAGRAHGRRAATRRRSGR